MTVQDERQSLARSNCASFPSVLIHPRSETNKTVVPKMFCIAFRQPFVNFGQAHDLEKYNEQAMPEQHNEEKDNPFWYFAHRYPDLVALEGH